MPLARSKKRVRWVVRQGEEVHNIVCSISFYSGKKKVQHNGHVILDVADSRECLDFIVILGAQRMIFTVDLDSEHAKVERKYSAQAGHFGLFENAYSQPPSQVY